MGCYITLANVFNLLVIFVVFLSYVCLSDSYCGHCLFDLWRFRTIKGSDVWLCWSCEFKWKHSSYSRLPLLFVWSTIVQSFPRCVCLLIYLDLVNSDINISATCSLYRKTYYRVFQSESQMIYIWPLYFFPPIYMSMATETFVIETWCFVHKCIYVIFICMFINVALLPIFLFVYWLC